MHGVIADGTMPSRDTGKISKDNEILIQILRIENEWGAKMLQCCPYSVIKGRNTKARSEIKISADNQLSRIIAISKNTAKIRLTTNSFG